MMKRRGEAPGRVDKEYVPLEDILGWTMEIWLIQHLRPVFVVST